MVRKQHISEDARMAIIRAKQNGRSNRDIASEFHIDQRTVGRIYARFQKTQNVIRKPGSGRPRKSSERQERAITHQIKCNPKRTAMEAKRYSAEHLRHLVSVWTVRRILRRAKLFARRPAHKPLISKKNRIARIQFARKYGHWNSDDWAKVVWSDESKFCLFSSSGIKWIRRPNGKRFDPKYQIPTVKHGGGNVMVWGRKNFYFAQIEHFLMKLLFLGCFSRDSIGPLVRIEGIMDKFKYLDILETSMLPHAREKMGPTWFFQHDRDPKHTSHVVRTWLNSEEIRVLEWPAQSPDLNPIEHLWEVLGRQIRSEKLKNLDDLMQKLQLEWSNISSECIKNLVNSLPERCKAVIKSKGFATKY